MRHRKSFNHLSRKKGHRKAMLSNMAASLIMHKRIKTTTAKAKALRMFIEPLITKSKDDSTHSRRIAFSYLQNKHAVTELFREISPKIAERPGGYTRILKTVTRLGDNADMCVIELVDYNENLLTAKSEAAEKTSRRRRRGARKKAIESEQVDKKIEADAKETSAPVEKIESKEVLAEEPKSEQEASTENKTEEVSDDVKSEAPAKEIDSKDVESKSDIAEVREEETQAPKAETEQEASPEDKTEKVSDDANSEAPAEVAYSKDVESKSDVAEAKEEEKEAPTAETESGDKEKSDDRKDNNKDVKDKQG